MKKLVSVIAAALTAGTLAATGISASAACHGGYGGHGHGCRSYAGTYAANIYPAAAHYFVDANGDGICDSCGGICLSNGLCSGKHSHAFVDANNDGICDSCGSNTRLPNGLCSNKHGYYFTDANGDGICDNYASGHYTQTGHHRGWGCR